LHDLGVAIGLVELAVLVDVEPGPHLVGLGLGFGPGNVSRRTFGGSGIEGTGAQRERGGGNAQNNLLHRS
jgi:hypothetical protein